MNLIRQSYKIVFLGDSFVGKSSILSRFIKNHFDPLMDSTIGASYFTTSLTIDNCLVRLEIWDTAGQERFKSLSPLYYRSSHAVIIVYDVNKGNSFEISKKWVDEIKNDYCLMNKDELLYPIIYIIGNKIDLGSESRKVKYEVAEKYAIENDISFLEVSAKDNINIMDLFHEVAYKLTEVKKLETSLITNVSLKITSDDFQNPSFRCCPPLL